MFGVLRRFTFIVAMLILSACGGGGGGGSPSYNAPTITGTSYNGNQQTISYSNGTTATNTATSAPVTWASDHITKTTTYTFANGGTNSVVTTVQPTVGSPTYNTNTQTIVTTYGDGYTTTATNTATSTPVTWASDHITKTTTYTFANGGTNPVVTSVPGTTNTPSLTASIYPSNWTTTGTVTAPSVSFKGTTYGDGYIAYAERGTSLLPFNQSTLSGLSISDPNAIVNSTSTTYDLTWGTPDKNGPSYVALFPNASTHLLTNLSYMGVAVSGQGVVGPTVVQPSTDVLAAWNAGWTGKGVNLLTIDDYSTIRSCNTVATCHGITTMMISDLVARGATKYSLDYNFSTNGTDINGTSLATLTQMKVVNMSFGLGPSSAADALVSSLQLVDSGLKVGTSQAVLVKSAGNNSGQDTYSYTAGGSFLVKSLVDNANTVSRLLIVGALNKNGTLASPATIANYSNYAGSTTAASNRFVVANGNAPYANGGVAMNGANISGYNSISPNYGTSYAAPVVAGYAAIIMQKFPNLNAINTSNIILDTARYDTLTCNPNCNPAIYGKGEASLSRALAPVGYLR